MGYEDVVVGAGAGGGPLAARFPLAGHKTLDQGLTYNYFIPAYSARQSEDEALAWSFFVRHYAGDERQARDLKTTYEIPGRTRLYRPQPARGIIDEGNFVPSH